MHYNEIFLVRANTPKIALSETETFLTKFKDKEWDWYCFGGRWAWGRRQKWVKQYEKFIVKPNTSHYWNEFHDPEAKGKIITIKFPDGTKAETVYGMNCERKILDYIEKHATETEVINATKSRFWAVLKIRHKDLTWDKMWSIKWLLEDVLRGATARNKMLNISGKQTKYSAKEQLKDSLSSLKWHTKKFKALTFKNRWINDLHFWNITDKSFDFDVNKIKAEPKKWWLINVDIHN